MDAGNAALDLVAPGGTRPRVRVSLALRRNWQYTRERMYELLAEGRIVHETTTPGSRRKVPRRKRYLDESKGIPAQDNWTDIRALRGQSDENTNYPTQKPLALLERIIKASSNEEDVVLDPFAGCATTAVAAERLNRRWIGIDVETESVNQLRVRLGETLGLHAPNGLAEAHRQSGAEGPTRHQGLAVRASGWRLQWLHAAHPARSARPVRPRPHQVSQERWLGRRIEPPAAMPHLQREEGRGIHGAAASEAGSRKTVSILVMPLHCVGQSIEERMTKWIS